jgi:hypothetical protein
MLCSVAIAICTLVLPRKSARGSVIGQNEQ